MFDKFNLFERLKISKLDAVFDMLREVAFSSNMEMEFASIEESKTRQGLLDKGLDNYFTQSSDQAPPFTFNMDSCNDLILKKQYNEASLSLDIAIKQFVREYGATIKSSSNINRSRHSKNISWPSNSQISAI